MTPSKEDYLKVMLGLEEEGGIRSVDIARTLGVSKASVSDMMDVLKNEGYIAKEKYGAVTLTAAGREVAAEVKRKYDLLKRFLHGVIGVDAATAAKDACRIEHLISCETAEQIGRQLGAPPPKKGGANGLETPGI